MIEFISNLFIGMSAINYITFISSIIAMFLSISSYRMSKRQLIANTITLNRFSSIDEMRIAIHMFLMEYLKKEDRNEYNLNVAKSKIELYLSHKGTFKEFIGILDKCSKEQFEEADYNYFLYEAQLVLNVKWHQMKDEAGIDYDSHEKRKLELYERIKNEHPYVKK